MARKKSERTVSRKPTRTRKTSGTVRGTRQAGTSSATKSQASVSVMPYTEAQIRERAYYIYLERGGALGDPLTDWLQAEQELSGLQARSGSVDRTRGEVR